MINQADNLQEQIEEALDIELASCSFQSDFALKLGFDEPTDISHLIKTKPSLPWAEKKTTSIPALYQIAADIPVLIFENAQIKNSTAAADLSDNLQSDGRIGADFFHRDVFSHTPSATPLTLLFNPEQDGRQAPTFYARIAAVQEAIMTLREQMSSQSKQLQTGFEEILKYGFSAMEGDRQIGHFINATLGHEFTQAVFDEISDEQKIIVPWGSGRPQIVIHSNQSDIVHARPASDDTENLNKAIDLEVLSV